METIGKLKMLLPKLTLFINRKQAMIKIKKPKTINEFAYLDSLEKSDGA